MSRRRPPPIPAWPALLLALAGCITVGPDYAPPKPPAAVAYADQSPTRPGDDGSALRFRSDMTPERQWWRALRSRELDDVVQRVLDGSFDLAAARARLQQARQLSIAAGENPYPELDLSAAVSNRAFNGAQFIGEDGAFNIYGAGAQVSYSPDIFGVLRRAAEGQAARADYAQYEVGAAYLSVLGNTVQEALAEAELTARRNEFRSLIDLDEQRSTLAQALVDAGRMPSSELLAYTTQLDRDRATLAQIERRLGDSRSALAVLAGHDPATWNAPPVDLAGLHLPTDLPLSVPSELVNHRPDIDAAVALVHVANAEVGVAVANFYPRVVISASTLFSLGADMSMPLLHWRGLQARKHASDATYQAALEDYRKTVIEAYSQVASVLRALRADRAAVARTDDVVSTSEKRLRLLQTENQIGRIPRMPLLDATYEDATARLEQMHAKAQLYRDVSQLYLAMGGGWTPEDGK